jgi:hypothetical protein
VSHHADESSSKSPNHAYPSAYGAKPWHDGGEVRGDVALGFLITFLVFRENR